MDLLTVNETAAILKINPETVRRHIASGRLPTVRIGRRVRVRRDALETLAIPMRPREEPVPAMLPPYPAPTPADLAQRRVAAAEIRAIREQAGVSRETSADLIHQVRAEQRRSHGL